MRFLLAFLLLFLLRGDLPLPKLLGDGWTILRGTLPAPDADLLNGQGLNTCPEPQAPLSRLLYQRTQGQGASLSCGNRVLGLIHFPNPDPSYSSQPASNLGGFAPLIGQILSAKREVLIANMLWDSGAQSPGAAIAAALAQMRLDLQAHPERYPDGLKVKIMLGHSIRLGNLTDPAANAYTAAAQLLAAGIPLGDDPVQGWHLELADYGYAMPHQHIKLIVVDRQDVSAGGYNVSWYHLPTTVRSPDALQGGGQGLNDLALRVQGPVARHAVAAFRDGWLLSHTLICAAPPTPNTVRQVCGFTAKPTFALEYAAPAPAAGNAHVYGLYRRSGYTEADDAITALFGAAQESIEVMQAQVSGTLRCSLTLVSGECRFPNDHLSVWVAALHAVRERHVRLRLLLDYDPLLRWEGLALLASFRAALRPDGLQDLVEARWYKEPAGTHAKAALVDGQLLTVGSQNLHFSSFGPQGLAEYTLATDDAATIQEFQTQFAFEWARASAVKLPWWVR